MHSRRGLPTLTARLLAISLGAAPALAARPSGTLWALLDRSLDPFF